MHCTPPRRWSQSKASVAWGLNFEQFVCVVVGVYCSVDRGFDPEHVIADARKQQPVTLPVAPTQNTPDSRQTAYLTRSQAKDKSWRPKPVYRCQAKRWLSNVDNQVRVSLSAAGLSVLVPDRTQQAWRSWRDWPYAAFAQDLGADGVCGYHALERHWAANVDLWGDAGHGCNRDFDMALKAASLGPFWLCLLIHLWNAHCAWWQTRSSTFCSRRLQQNGALVHRHVG